MKEIALYVVYDLIHLTRGTGIADATPFFICSMVTISLLLAVIIFAGSLYRRYFSQGCAKDFHMHKKMFIDNIPAAFLCGGV
ncbi:MAG: hypothetical protein P8Z71_05310 [Candidatus Sulfobium sp.]|jgi:hypothetical protein